MEKQVSIARALKEKNRIAGRLKAALNQVSLENSREKNIPRGIDVMKTYDSAKDLRERLIRIKTAIAVANKGIVGKIIRLGEIKSEIAYLESLDTKAGKFQKGYSEDAYTEIESVISKKQALDEIGRLQKAADGLQDEIDEYNATTKVEIEID